MRGDWLVIGDFTAEQIALRDRCRELAAEFATRAAEHDRDASHPGENYEILRDEGFHALNVPEKWGGRGIDFLGHTLAFEALGAGCPSTALAYNMHASMVGPILESDEVGQAAKEMLADLVVNQRALIAGNFSETSSTSLIGERHIATRATRVDGGFEVTGRKMFASMLEAADHCCVMTYPDDANGRWAGLLLLIPRRIAGKTVNANWDTLGMRATRSDSMVLEKCLVPADRELWRGEDMRPFREKHSNWLWGSYTAVYLGVAQAAYDEARRVVKERRPPGYSQSLAYHPDVRRRVAEMSATLESARLVTYHAAWLRDREGPTATATAALFRAKYVVGEAVSRITRSALTMGGAHAIFKGHRLEQLFRDGAIGPIMAPQADFSLHNVALHELDLVEDDIVHPLKPE